MKPFSVTNRNNTPLKKRVRSTKPGKGEQQEGQSDEPLRPAIDDWANETSIINTQAQRQSTTTNNGYVARFGGCLALRRDYELGQATASQWVGFLGFFEWVQVLSCFLDSLSQEGGTCGGFGGSSIRSSHQSSRFAYSVI
ncbi:hypothetical protein Rs2_48700 [Raphanus sativus]|nr:hypothetical protein Rs2_48700 [Raphanus sativus]